MVPRDVLLIHASPDGVYLVCTFSPVPPHRHDVVIEERGVWQTWRGYGLDHVLGPKTWLLIHWEGDAEVVDTLRLLDVRVTPGRLDSDTRTP